MLSARTFRRFATDESGVIVPLAVFVLLGLLGFCALVLDVGIIYGHRRNLQNAADAAALAAAREIQREMLGASGVNPSGMAETFALNNGVPTVYGDCLPNGTGSLVWNDDGPLPHSWQVVVSRRVPLIFGGAIGIQSSCVRARAVAVVTQLRGTKLWPWGLSKVAYEWLLNNYGSCATNLSECAPFRLKEGSQGSSSGNFGIVDFTCDSGGSGSSEYERWVYNGYGTTSGEIVPGPIPYNEWVICSGTGNKASINKDFARYIEDQKPLLDACKQQYGADVRCTIIGLIPIIKEADWGSGASKPITIIDFAVFQLEEVSVAGGTGQMEIYGRFLKFAGGTGPTEVPDPNGQLRGLIGIRLWEP